MRAGDVTVNLMTGLTSASVLSVNQEGEAGERGGTTLYGAEAAVRQGASSGAWPMDDECHKLSFFFFGGGGGNKESYVAGHPSQYI